MSAGLMETLHMEVNHEVKRSALRYFGGKWAIAPWVIEHMPEHRVYVEPFGGAASVLLRKPRSRVEVYNDLDDEIVGLFRILQNPVECQRLTRLLRRTPYARREFEQAFQATDDALIRSQRAIIRAYMSFHHEALFNPKKNTFADARHRSDANHCKAREWASYPRHLASICRRLRGVIIDSQDALQASEVRNQESTPPPPLIPDTRYLIPTRPICPARDRMRAIAANSPRRSTSNC